MNSKIKNIFKKFIDYSIEDDVRKYRLKHTKLLLYSCPLTKRFEEKYGALPVVPNKIIVDNYMGQGYGCNGKYVTKELLLRTDSYDIVWVVKDKEAQAAEFPAGIRLVEYLSEEAMYEYATAAIWLCNYHLIKYFNQGLTKKPGQCYIQMWHGSFGIKKIENDTSLWDGWQSWQYLAKKNVKNTDFWISNSSFETEVYRSAFWGAGTILEFGHPRNDIFFTAQRDGLTERLKARYRIGAEENICLFVPTFREKSVYSMTLWDAEATKAALTERDGVDYRMLIRFHPRTTPEERESFLAAHGGVTDVTDYPDIQELLVAADVVITDYSSCIFDFLLGGGEGHLFVPDKEIYDEERGFYYPLKETPFPLANSNESLCENIRNFDRVSYEENVAEFLQSKGSVEDGRASERVAELVFREAVRQLPKTAKPVQT